MVHLICLGKKFYDELEEVFFYYSFVKRLLYHKKHMLQQISEVRRKGAKVS